MANASGADTGPVSGVFSLPARLAPMHHKVNEERWQAKQGQELATSSCAPLIDTCRMQGNCEYDAEVAAAGSVAILTVLMTAR